MLLVDGGYVMAAWTDKVDEWDEQEVGGHEDQVTRPFEVAQESG